MTDVTITVTPLTILLLVSGVVLLLGAAGIVSDVVQHVSSRNWYAAFIALVSLTALVVAILCVAWRIGAE